MTASNGYSISFQALTNRSDLYGDKRLDRIEISNGDEVIKSYIFEYKDEGAASLQFDYFNLTRFDNGTYNGPYLNGDLSFVDQKYQILVDGGSNINEEEYVNNYAYTFASEHFRQYLVKITEVSKSDVLKRSYGFTYNSTKLPRRFSYKSDYFGYFNENTRGTTIRKIHYIGFGGDNVPRSNWPLIGWDNSFGEEDSYLGAILSPSLSYSRAGTLKEIRYPTGGLTKYYYKLNSIEGNTACGLCVEKQTRFSNLLDIDEFSTEQYSYSDGRQASGMKFEYSLASSIFGNNDIYSNSDFAIPGSLTKGGVVGYQKAKRFQIDNGFNTYTFRSPLDIGNSNSLVYEVEEESPSPNRFPFPPQLDRDWQRGMVIECMATMSDEDGILEKANSDYIFQSENFNMVEIFGLIPGIYYVDGHPRYRAGIYKYQSGWYYKDKTTNTVYSSTDPGDESKAVVNQVDYDYKVITHDDQQYTFLDSQTELNSKSQPQEITYTYPLDISDPTDVLTTQPVIDELISKHMLSTILKTEKSNNYKKVEGQINTYRVEFVDEEEFHVVPSVTNVLEDDSYKPKIYYDFYDNLDNIIEYHKKDNYSTTFLWGYNYQYPIAKIENAEYSYVMGQLNNILYTDLQSKTSEQLESIFNSLRQKPGMADKNVYSYTYDPLIGMTSETDPNGITTIYAYDDFGRLETIRDKDFNVLKHVDYNYEFSAEIDCNSTYDHGKIETFTATIFGGSGNFSYSWEVVYLGEVFKTGSGETLTMQMTDAGHFTLKCTITDNESGNSMTVTKYFIVYTRTCTYTDIDKNSINDDGSYIISYAKLWSPYNEVVKLKVLNLYNATDIFIRIGDGSNQYLTGTTMYYDAIFDNNSNNCDIQIFAPNLIESDYIEVEIISVENNNTSIPNDSKKLILNRPPQ